jgi:hypothetical protein
MRSGGAGQVTGQAGFEPADSGEWPVARVRRTSLFASIASRCSGSHIRARLLLHRVFAGYLYDASAAV